jgi:periplasmic protein TonB
MPLRCLLFSSDEATAEPIGQVLTELGIEAERCSNPVDAVERVTTQSFQIVITDWKDQPEAAFLLKTARDLKAAARPLTLAIVNEEGRPHALQAGANSVLLKPIRPEQVRDTMSTACQLLQSKFQAAAPTATRTPWQSGTATAVGSNAAGAAPAPAFAVPAPEKLRAGEFLQSTGSAPGSQFDTESEVRSAIEASSAPVDSLTELEPMAAAVQDVPEAKPEPKEALTGWAALQARLSKSAPAPLKEVSEKNELTSYDDPSPLAPTGPASKLEGFPTQAAKQPNAVEDAARVMPREEAVVSQTSGDVEDESTEIAVPRSRAKRGKIFVLGLALASVVLVAMPRTREKLKTLSRTGARAALRWLNPPPPPMPQTVTQHDSFGQPDEEYKLPATANIPDSTTDPSKIEVVPVIDPTAKPDKSAAANTGQTQAVTEANGAQPAGGGQPPATSGQSAASDQNAMASTPNSQNPTVATPISNPVTGASGNSPASSGSTGPATVGSAAQPQPAAAQPVSTPPPPPMAQPTQVQPPQVHTASSPVHSSPPPQVSASQLAGIPSSLKSQVASSVPEMSGAKPDDSAPSSIEPVTLPESAVRGLLDQASDPQYPAAAKASGQQGSVVLQVLIGADGAVQDAKFMQGSFVFARAAIEAVKQWRFKPYSMNGRAVSVQSVITLSFKPPA